jgi:hypothetical protein
MKRVALLLSLCVACESEPRLDSGTQPVLDAGRPPDVATTTQPVASADASIDLHFLLIAAMIEVERSLIARCPCLIENGAYDSMSQCVKAVSLGRDWVDCANTLELSDQDDDALRDSLRCNIEELTQRSECLMGSACSDEAVATCMTQSLGCAMLPLDALSRVTVECGIALSR